MATVHPVPRPALVQVPSADGVTALVARLADRAADLVLRTGVAPERVGALVETTAIGLVDVLAADPAAVTDPAGVWFADLHRNAVRVRESDAAPPQRPARRRAKAGEDDPVQQVERALAGLDERRALALLLRDSYDLPWASVGAALGLSEQDGATVVADAREQLLLAVDGTEPAELAAHGELSGISYATLARLADADAIDQHDPLGVARAQHVRGCARCGEFLASQQAARRALAALPVRALADAEHERIVRAVEQHADSRLPSTTALEKQVADARPPSLLLAALLLVGAVGVGITIGALTADHAPDQATPFVPSVSGSVTPSVTPSALVSQTASASPTVSASATATASSSAVVTTSARPSSVHTATPVVPPRTSTSAPVAVQPAITLSPTGGPRGTVITVRGVGFTPGDAVTVTYRHGLIGSSTGTATVAGDGTFSATVTASDPFAGSHLVTARDQHGVSASTTFEQG